MAGRKANASRRRAGSLFLSLHDFDLLEAERPHDSARHMNLHFFASLQLLALAVTMVLCGCRSGSESGAMAGSREPVGKTGRNRYVTPANQVLTPAGLQVDLPEMRPQVLALSPNGKILVTSGKTAEVVV